MFTETPGSTLSKRADDRVVAVFIGVNWGKRFDQRRRAHGFRERTDCGGGA